MIAGKKTEDRFCTNLRLPKKLAKAVKKAAEESNRSLNAEIEFTLKEKYAKSI